MAHPTRIAILRALVAGPKCVTDIHDLASVAQANASQHLAVLRSQSIVDYHESGNLRCYYIARPVLVEKLLSLLDCDDAPVWQSAEAVREAAQRRSRLGMSAACSTEERRSTKRISPQHTTRQSHWQKIYETQADDQTSWFQHDPAPSLDLIRTYAPPRGRIIDVGGGSSVLAGRLAQQFDVSVLDISAAAIERAKQRNAEAAKAVHWVVADVLDRSALGTFDIWHDRAVFHFFTEAADRQKYVQQVSRCLPEGGHVVIGAFGLNGPDKCSGLPVERYDSEKLAGAFGDKFQLVSDFESVHTAPWGTPQAFVYTVLRRSVV